MLWWCLILLCSDSGFDLCLSMIAWITPAWAGTIEIAAKTDTKAATKAVRRFMAVPSVNRRLGRNGPASENGPSCKLISAALEKSSISFERVGKAGLPASADLWEG